MVSDLTLRLERWSSKKVTGLLVYGSSLLFFILVVLTPSFIGIFLKWGSLHEVLRDPSMFWRCLNSISNSFIVASAATLLDLSTGLPLAWFIARRGGKSIEALDTLVDLPLIVPTVALGYSVLLLWGETLNLAVPGFLLVFLLHLTFTYPYIVRTIVGVIRDTEFSYEIAARTLGASPATTIRTVSLPIIKPGIVVAAGLSFARSLSETGATMVVAGPFNTGPIFIKRALEQGLDGPLVFVSVVLIAASVLLLLVVNYFARRLRIPIRHAFPRFERELSKPICSKLASLIVAFIFLVLIFIPAFFFLSYSFSSNFQVKFNSDLWSSYLNSFYTSFLVATVVTSLNILTGLPLAMAIAKRKFGFLTDFIDAIVNVSILVPTIVLGASLKIFWVNMGFSNFLPEVLLIALAHTSITYPFIVKVLSASISSINPEIEEVARSLGAPPLRVFRTIMFPLTKASLFAGSILVFARSIDETGATMAVAEKTPTVPVLLVDWIKAASEGVYPKNIPAIGCMVLTLATFLVMFVSRILLRGGGKRVKLGL